MHFSNILTLGIVTPRVFPSWHKDFANAFATYYKKKFNFDVVLAPDIDSLLRACQTKFLLIQSVSHVVHDAAFFDALIPLENNIVVGYVQLSESYARLEEHCLFLNMELWKQAESPMFAGKQGSGADFNVVDGGLERTGDNTMILHDDAAKGGRIIDAQLKIYGRLYEFPSQADEQTFLFDSATPYHEIHFETLFENTVLKKRQSMVHHENGDELSVPDGKADVLVTHAGGLTPSLLAEHYDVKKIYVVDYSQPALDFQRLLFSIDKPTLYGDIVATFKEEHPNAILVGDFDADEYAVVQPLNVEVEYVHVNLFGYELEEITKGCDHSTSMVFNLDDIFIVPFNYYKRSRAQGQGLFKQMWSNLISRTGPTRFIGCNSFGVAWTGDVINGDTTKFDTITNPGCL